MGAEHAQDVTESITVRKAVKWNIGRGRGMDTRRGCATKKQNKNSMNE